jgi:hypothetical protein
MKNLLGYQDFLLVEKNRTVDFFQKHPELLSKYSQGIPSGKEEFDPGRHNVDNRLESQRLEKLQTQLAAKINALPGSSNVQSLPVGQYDNLKNFLDDLLGSKNFDDFADKFPKRYWTLSKESWSSGKELAEYPELYKFFKENFSKIQDIYKWYSKGYDGIKGSAQKGYVNDLMKLGLSEKDIEVAMSHIEVWTSMSRKKLDPQVWPLLQKISVDSSLLPKYVYRGIFYDGAKIKDQGKFLQAWKPGSKPGVSQGKATSWSIDRGTASRFMVDQDFIKDNQNGFYVLLKWKVDPKYVIADLRNLPVDHAFWNQQEIIVSPEARDYEVDTIIPGKSGYEGLQEFQRTIKGGQGAWGQSREDFAQNFLATPYETLSPYDRLEFKQIAKMTVGEFRKAYPKSNVTDLPEWQKVPFPIWSYRSRHMSNVIVDSVSGNTVKFHFEFLLSSLDRGKASKVSAAYNKIRGLLDFNPYSSTKEIRSDVGTITLNSNAYYDIQIQINLPTKFYLTGKEGDSERENAANKALQLILDEAGSQGFLEFAKNSIDQTPTSRNMEITVK